MIYFFGFINIMSYSRLVWNIDQLAARTEKKNIVKKCVSHPVG